MMSFPNGWHDILLAGARLSTAKPAVLMLAAFSLFLCISKITL